MAEPQEHSGEPHQGATRSRSLRLELLATLAMVLVMTVLTLSFVAEMLAQQRHEDQEIERLRVYASGLATLSAREFRSPRQADREGLRALMHQSLASQLGVMGIRVFVVGEQSSVELEAVGLSEDYPPPTSATPNVDETRLRRQNILVIDEPVPVFGQARGETTPVLRVVAQPNPWTSQYEWRQTLIVAAGVAIVMLLLGGLMLELQILRPLRNVEEATQRLTTGDLEARVPEEGAREFQELARRFNRMTEGLAEQRDKIEEQSRALQRSEQLAAIGRLAAGVAHEVGNPLAAVHGYTEFLLDPRSELDEEQRSLLERMRSQTERIQGIVGQLLDYSRPQVQKLEPVALREIADRTIELLRGDPRSAGVQFSVSGSADVRVTADAGQLEQVLLNLVVNAMLAARDGDAEQPAVEVRTGTRISDGQPWLEVQDNGGGVAEDDRAHLFEPFFTRRKAGEGTGLGLAISQGLVDRMEGQLTCLEPDARSPLADGDPPGAVFRIELPAAATQD